MSVSLTIFMQEALWTAAEGLARGELPIGALVVLHDQLIARAYTTERTEHYYFPCSLPEPLLRNARHRAV